MSYTDLPAEILNQIASHLEINEAISLAQTSSFSQPAAESRIWRDIKIDADCRFTYFPNDPHSQVYGDQEDPERPREKYYQPYISTILLQPFRSSLVRSLTVEPQFTPPPEFPKLLALIAGGLHYLSIRYPAGLLVPATPLAMISKMIEDIHMPALETIDVDIGGNWHCLRPLLRGSRGLKRLTIRGPESLGGVTASAMGIGTLGYTTRRPISSVGEIIEFDIPDTLRLEYLSIDRMDVAVVPLLAKIVRNSPKVKTVILRDPLMAWTSFPHSSSQANDTSPSPQDDPLLAALSTSRSLISLEIPSPCLKRMEDLISHQWGFRHITDLTILWGFTDLRACSMSEEVNIPSPPPLTSTLPNLKHCIFTLRTHHCSDVPPYSIYRGYIFDLSIRAIKYQALHGQFESTPSLESIQLKDIYRYKAGDCHSRCETEFDGALVTRFPGANGDLLVLLRHRVAHSCGWEEYGVFNGKEVPKSCLDGVMLVNGLTGRKRKSIEPGWGRLKEGAWEVLRHWATLE